MCRSRSCFGSANGLLLASRSCVADTEDYVSNSSRRTARAERVIRTLNEPCVHRDGFKSLRHAWVGDRMNFCNHRRPHQAFMLRANAGAYALAARPVQKPWVVARPHSIPAGVVDDGREHGQRTFERSASTLRKRSLHNAATGNGPLPQGHRRRCAALQGTDPERWILAAAFGGG